MLLPMTQWTFCRSEPRYYFELPKPTLHLLLSHYHQAMATVPEDSSPPAIRFKRRKIAHPKRAYAEDDAPTVSASQSPDAATRNEVHSPPPEGNDADESVPNLKEILRNRRRPRDRIKETARKTEAAPSSELVQDDGPRPDQYTSRFVAQTGQVVDRHDKQM